MKILFIGGTGNLSRDCTALALARELEVFHLNRGKSSGETFAGVRTITADIRKPDEAGAAIQAFCEREKVEFDAVVDFIAFRPQEALSDFDLFSGLCRQFVFISSASVYTKPSRTARITEDSPVGNTHWSYASDKLACEEALQGLRRTTPALTIVRPSHTYSSRWIPSPFISSDFTLAKRILDGKPLVVPGDGTMRWTLTHTRDFAVGLLGLLGNSGAYGRIVQIMSEEAPSWNEIHLELARAIGEALRADRFRPAGRVDPAGVQLVHIPVDFIASVDPESGAKLLGDKGYTSLFDCSLLRSLVPDFSPHISFAQGIRESLAWFFADSSRQKTNQTIDAAMDRILNAWETRSAGIPPAGFANTEKGI